MNPDDYDDHSDADLTAEEVGAVGGVAVAVHPGGSVCAQKRSPEHLHMDAWWTTPKALCDFDAPIHPDDITRNRERVTCAECLDVLRAIDRLESSLKAGKAE